MPGYKPLPIIKQDETGLTGADTIDLAQIEPLLTYNLKVYLSLDRLGIRGIDRTIYDSMKTKPGFKENEDKGISGTSLLALHAALTGASIPGELINFGESSLDQTIALNEALRKYPENPVTFVVRNKLHDELKGLSGLEGLATGKPKNETGFGKTEYETSFYDLIMDESNSPENVARIIVNLNKKDPEGAKVNDKEFSDGVTELLKSQKFQERYLKICLAVSEISGKKSGTTFEEILHNIGEFFVNAYNHITGRTKEAEMAISSIKVSENSREHINYVDTLKRTGARLQDIQNRAQTPTIPGNSGGGRGR